MLLTLDTRHVGRVTVFHCTGRIQAGPESEFIHHEINELLSDRQAILLNLEGVTFLDSSGLGSIVRAFNNARQARVDFKLSNLPPHVRRILKVTCLEKVFDTHETEEAALESFFRSRPSDAKTQPNGRSILCFGSNVNVLAYLRQLLHGAGYEVQTAGLVNDARLLIRVTPVDLVLIGAEKADVLTSSPAFRDACARIPILELDQDFATKSAEEAGTELLSLLETKLKN